MWESVAKKIRQLAQSPSRAFLAFVVAFLVGVSAHAVFERQIEGTSMVAMIFLGALAFGIAARVGRSALFVLVVLVCVAVGFWRYEVAWRSSAYAQPAIEVEGERFEGVIVGFVRERENNTVLLVETEFGLAQAYARSPHSYIYGDRIEWGCKPQPVVAEDGGWQDRLLLDGVRWTCNIYSSPQVISRGEGSPVRAVLYSLKRGVVRSAERVLPEPEASFLLGLVVGAKDGLPAELTDAFRDTGTTHILAVSGYNVTQLINVGVLLLALALVPRRKSAGTMAIGVIIFACVVGGDASVIRAAIMGCVGILATLYSRRYSGVRALLAAAALMLAVNPLVLRHDVGFQLSFVAVWGLHSLAPGLLTTVPLRWRGSVARILCETGSATLATMPIVLYSFGRLPAIGLLANLLILPLVPWAMLFGSLAALIGLVSVPFALVPALAAAWIMRAAEYVALTFARHIPLALEVQVGTVTVVLLYGWLLLFSMALSRRGREYVR
jgi:ComEC/Rec2-related protein